MFTELVAIINAIKFDKISYDHWASRWAKYEEWYNRSFYPKSDARRFCQQCFKTAWTRIYLHHDFKFPGNYSHLNSNSKIDCKGVHENWGTYQLIVIVTIAGNSLWEEEFLLKYIGFQIHLPLLLWIFYPALLPGGCRGDHLLITSSLPHLFLYFLH